MRPASRGSLEKSMPGTTCSAQNATCSVSAKKLSGLRFKTMRPIGRTGTSSSGMSLVASRMSKLNASRSEEHTSELQSQSNLVCRLLLEKKKKRFLIQYKYPTQQH